MYPAYSRLSRPRTRRVLQDVPRRPCVAELGRRWDDSGRIRCGYPAAVNDGFARELSRSLLAAELPQRWTHSQGVARRAHTVAGIVPEHASAVVSAAWLHDIGYASALVDSGFHPL